MNKNKTMAKSDEFPKCTKDCEIVRVLGVGECDSVCPQKFNVIKPTCPKCGSSCYDEDKNTKRCQDCYTVY